MKFDRLTDKKQALDVLRPLPDAIVRNLDDWFRVELTYTSNAIEGNTLNRRETALVLEKGIAIGGKLLKEHLEATNHAQAFDWIGEQVNHNPDHLAENDILHIHEVILKGIDDANAGHYRSVPIRISGSTVVLPNPVKVPDLMCEFAEWLASDQELHPVEFAAEAHYRLVTIHPFVDGNGRSARLLMNMLLLLSGYPAAIIRKRDRLTYIQSLGKAQLGGSKEDYLKIIAKAVERSLNIYLSAASRENSEPVKEYKLLKIGELAKQVGERISTVRYWTKQGLLDVAEITDAGYQLYSPKLVDRIRQIQALKKQRFTLHEIMEKVSSTGTKWPE